MLPLPLQLVGSRSGCEDALEIAFHNEIYRAVGRIKHLELRGPEFWSWRFLLLTLTLDFIPCNGNMIGLVRIRNCPL